MFVFVFAVPALLVVLLGYVVGYGLWTWLGELVDAAAGTSLAACAEPAGWVTGLLALVLLVRAVVRRRRRRGVRPPESSS
jgi:membrane associated rhomboid family serine protease